MLHDELVQLARSREITYKDAILILLVRDGLKPMSTVGIASSQALIGVLSNNDVSFVVKNNRIFIGNFSKTCNTCKFFSKSHCNADASYKGPNCSINIHDGIRFGFPDCCSTLFFNPISLFFAKNSKPSFSELTPYVFHVPCSENCTKTRKLAEKYMQHVKVNYPAMARYVECIA